MVAELQPSTAQSAPISPPSSKLLLFMYASVRNDQRHLMDSAGDVCYEVGSGISRYLSLDLVVSGWSGCCVSVLVSVMLAR